MNHYHHHITTVTQNGTDSDSCSDEDLARNHTPHSSSNLGNPSRKRRRGIIEKRRRDRINTSLSELKRLVPQALEKSGSAKLEKAEILQMTVDHLKTISANNMGYVDNSRVARDYHGVGFRECAAEVSRYLVSVEGMDAQDPLRIRLMSHLQMFITQRSSNPVHVSPAAAPPPPPPPSSGNYPGSWGPYQPPPPPHGAYGYEKEVFDPFYCPRSSQSTNNSTASPTNYTMTMTATAPIGFTASVQANPIMLPYPHHPSLLGSQGPEHESTTSPSSNPSYLNLSSSKPYRPWGAEMAC